MSWIRPAVAAGAAGISLLAATPVAADHTATTDNGATLAVDITTPNTGDRILIAPGNATIDVPVAGTASIGEGVPDALWIYVVDASTSTGSVCGATNILACEKEAVLNLNNEVVANNGGSAAGVAAFAGGGATADMVSGGGDELTVAPADPGVATVINSIGFLSIGQFTPRAFGDGTNFAAGLQAAHTIASSSSAAAINVVFMSDGQSNQGGGAFGGALAALAGIDGVQIFPFAVGAGANCAGGAAGTLDQIATATGTTCTSVPDPTNLPDIVQDLAATTLDAVSLTIDGGATGLASVVPAVPAPGPVSVDWTATAAGQAPGSHEACATATGSDVSSTTSVSHCETYGVFAFNLQPPSATNELGVDSSHTVVASVTGPAGDLAGWPVTFAVTSGPNTGVAGTCDPVACTTAADGTVSFTYAVPVAPASLGTDTISATLDLTGQTATLTVEKLWQDTTPPTAQCVTSTNPAGNEPASPGNGTQHQNPDGFFRLVAVDDVWGTDVDLFVRDNGSGHVFGPFPVDTDIKWTEANGAAPSQRPGPGVVEWALKGQGDAVLTAVDGSGNVSAEVTCLVPNAPS